MHPHALTVAAISLVTACAASSAIGTNVSSDAGFIGVGDSGAPPVGDSGASGMHEADGASAETGTTPDGGLTCRTATTHQWSPLSSANEPTVRVGPWVIPTDDGMIVWGGAASNGSGAAVGASFDNGAVYHLCSDSWTTMNTAGAPSGVTDQIGHPVPLGTWTGKDLIVWGGSSPSAILIEGTPVAAANLYNVGADEWSAMNRSGEPTARDDDARVWTGSRLLVWGGVARSGDTTCVNHNDGALFDPSVNRWTPMTLAGAPSARDPYGQFVWTGSKFIVWGGLRWDACAFMTNTWTTLTDGAMYDVASGMWTTLATAGAPVRGLASLLWTGTKMIALAKLDGYTTPGQVDFDGALFDPVANTWSPMNPPSLALAQALEDPLMFTPPRKVLWTGSAMVVFGNKLQPGAPTPTALLYNPETNAWSGVGTSGWPAFFSWQLAAFPGQLATFAEGKLLVAGPGPSFPDARGAAHQSTSLALFDPSTVSWASLPPLVNRANSAIVVSAHHLLVWGGQDIFTDLDAGNPCMGADGPCDPVTPTAQTTLGNGASLGL